MALPIKGAPVLDAQATLEFFERVEEMAVKERQRTKSVEFVNRGMGSQLLQFIKQFCDINYPSFCRFLLVEAYNEPSVLNFYRKNDFNFVFSTEEQERDYYKRANIPEPLRTRIINMIHRENQ
jgi:hypothetical protein